MKKAKIFYGEAESGKTRKAREIAEGRECLYLDGKMNFKRLNKKTDLIIIDDVPNNFKWEDAAMIISQNELTVHQHCKNNLTIPTPEFIFITNEKPKFEGASIERRFELIEFKKL